MTSPHVCNVCMARGSDGGRGPLLRCSTCRTSYCSQSCQAVDWVGGGHRAECRKLGALQSSLRAPADFESALLLSRVTRGGRTRAADATLPPIPLYVHTLVDVATMATAGDAGAATSATATAVSAAPRSLLDELRAPPTEAEPPAASRRAGAIITALRSVSLLPATIDAAVAQALLERFRANALGRRAAAARRRAGPARDCRRAPLRAELRARVGKRGRRRRRRGLAAAR